MRSKGKLKSWNDDKGFGFIRPVGGGSDVFVHINAFANRARRPEAGQMITYGLSTDKQGRPCAANATLPGDRPVQKSRRSIRRVPILFALFFLAFVGVAVVQGSVHRWFLAGYLAMSLLVFAMYAIDKSAARHGRWRVQEQSLQLLSLLGGWPGAILAQETLRHKSKKQSFRVVFWMTVILNIGAFAWLQTTGANQVDFQPPRQFLEGLGSR